MIAILTLVLALQEETAREEYAKIVRSIEQAKTLKVDFQGEAVERGKEDQRLKYAGKVLLKEGNKTVWTMTLPGRPATENSFVSDGKKALFLVGKIKPLSPDPDPASPQVRSTIHHALCGLGIFHSCAELVGTIIT